MSRSVVWDNHACLPLQETARFLPQLERYRAAGVNAVTINIGDSVCPLETLIQMAARIRSFVKAHPEKFLLGLTVSDLRDARASGRLAVCFDVEGVHALGEELALVELLHDVGVRWMLLVYNRRNLAGSGCHDAEDDGLTQLGRQLLAEMDRVGIIKCCSHTGYSTAREILETSRKPVIFSHSNPRALHDHPRNIPDDLIKRCAATGGVVGINGVGLFLGASGASAALIVRHIDYVAQLVGAEHVGLGLDYVFDPGDGAWLTQSDIWPREWGYGTSNSYAAPEVIPEIIESLQKLGYGEADIDGILGENLLRVAAQVWRP